MFHPVTSRFASLHSSRLLDAEEEGNAKGKAADITHSEHKELGRRKNIEASLDVKTDNERAPNLHSCLHKLILLAHEINQAVFLGPQWLISSVMTVLRPTRKPRGALLTPAKARLTHREFTPPLQREEADVNLLILLPFGLMSGPVSQRLFLCLLLHKYKTK